MLLGEMLRQSDPEDSLKWFIAAGNRGQTEAMVNAGQMLASGRGVHAPDLSEAAIWFSKAAEQGDSAGMYVLAECHLFRKGSSRRSQACRGTFDTASALNNPRAMNLLGDIYRKGVPGVIEPDYCRIRPALFASPRAWVSRCAGQSWRALHLRTGRSQGRRTRPSRSSGMEQRRGTHCVCFSMRCVSRVASVLRRIREAAREWYVRAAQGGNKTALDWCKKNNIPLASPP